MEPFRLLNLTQQIRDFSKPQRLTRLATDSHLDVGVARFARETVARLWEQHDRGDELLVILKGELSLRLRAKEGEQRHRLQAGDLFLIPREVPHSFDVLSEELELLYATPGEGNRGWNEQGDAVHRHA